MMFFALLHGISLSLSVILLVIVAEICKYKFGGTRTPFWITLVVQGLFYGLISYAVWTNFPSSAAIIGAGVAAAIIVITALFGLLLYPVVFLLVNRPTRWKLYLKRCLIGYGLALLALVSPRLVTMTGLTSNVDLYGKVVDINDRPVPNASVTLKNCGYYKDNPVVTDRDGIFHIVATCNLLIIERITNPATQSDCEPDQKNAEYLLSIQDDPDFSRLWKKGIHWEHRLRENPYRFECIWHTPTGLREYRISERKVTPDGRPYHIAPVTNGRKKRLGLVEGIPKGGLEFAFFIDDPAALINNEPSSGRMEISFTDGGGIQEATRFGSRYAAPADNYRDKVIFTFDDLKRFRGKSYYFQSSAGTHFGAFNIDIRDKRSKSTLDIYITLNMDRDGSRVILADRAKREKQAFDNLPF